MVWTGGFSISCVFCKTEYGYINYDFGDFIFHLRYFHNVTLNQGLVLAISDQNQTALDFLQTSLSSFTAEAGGYPEQMSCTLCGDAITLVRECGGDYRPSAMESHLMEGHLLVFATEMFVNISLLSSTRLASLIDTLLLKNPFRLGRYNKFKKRVNMLIKKEKNEAAEKKRISLLPKLQFLLEDTAEKQIRRYKVRSDKGIKKGKRLKTILKPRVMYNCEVCPYKSDAKMYIKRHERIHTGEKTYQCDSCDERFRTTSSLSGHRKRHHLKEKGIICTDCGKSYLSVGELNRHSFSHLEVKPRPFKCDICSYCSSLKFR